MAATNISAEAMLNYLPLTEAVNQVIADLPKPLPDAFYNQTRDIPGDAFRRFLFTPTRQTAKRARRGSPPKRVDQTVVKVQDAKAIHSIEEIEFGPEIYKLFHSYTNYEQLVFGAQDEMRRRAMDFGRRQLNLRTAAIHSVLALGYIYFDVNDEILPTSSGAVETIDFLIPAGNRRTASATWATATNDIPGMIEAEMHYMRINSGGFTPRYALYGANVLGYLAKNTSFQNYLARDARFRDTYIKSNTIADGVLDLTWLPMAGAYFERSDGTFPQQFPADQIVFLPELTRDIYELKQGSQPVPKLYTWGEQTIDPVAAFKAMMDNPVYGVFRSSVGRVYPVPEVICVQGDNFLPDFPNPQAIWYYDTTT
jgi:hypothetical protein